MFAFIPIVGVVAGPLVIIGLTPSLVGLPRATKGAATAPRDRMTRRAGRLTRETRGQ